MLTARSHATTAETCDSANKILSILVHRCDLDISLAHDLAERTDLRIEGITFNTYAHWNLLSMGLQKVLRQGLPRRSCANVVRYQN
jgi:hypothetical protein